MGATTKSVLLAATMLTALPLAGLHAAETAIGKHVSKYGMDIGAVYLQPVVMEPMLPDINEDKDIHLEADIHAEKGNKNGFGPGDWVSYLGVTYHLQKVGTDWEKIGTFMPMVANDGPHYGANVKLDGAGKYKLTYRITPPPYQGFYRHTDKETGVAKWWPPFEVSWTFTYVGGPGKKGAY